MEQGKNTEQLILESAETLFFEQGFAKTTTAQIAQRAGCNHALVHYYYRTKDKLFDKIYEEKAKILINNFLSIKAEGATFEERIAMKAGAYFDFLRENQKLPIFFYNEVSTNPARFKTLVDKIKIIPNGFLEEVDKELQEEIEKGNIHPISAIDLLFTVISLNIMPFFISPIMQSVLDLNPQQADLMLDNRRKEVIQTIIARLKT